MNRLELILINFTQIYLAELVTKLNDVTNFVLTT